MHWIQPYLKAYFTLKVPFTYNMNIVITILINAEATGIQINSFIWKSWAFRSLLFLFIQRFIFIHFAFFRFFSVLLPHRFSSLWISWLPRFVSFAQILRFSDLRKRTDCYLTKNTFFVSPNDTANVNMMTILMLVKANVGIILHDLLVQVTAGIGLVSKAKAVVPAAATLMEPSEIGNICSIFLVGYRNKSQ